MKWVKVLLNIPWSIVGLVAGILSGPRGVEIKQAYPACVVRVKAFWWLTWLKRHKGSRAITIGNTVLLSSKLLPLDLEHELIHVEQSMRVPFIHPFLYQWELLRKGYVQNKYEIEAYHRVGNIYKEK